MGAFASSVNQLKRIATPGEGEPERPALELHLVMTDPGIWCPPTPGGGTSRKSLACF